MKRFVIIIISIIIIFNLFACNDTVTIVIGSEESGNEEGDVLTNKGTALVSEGKYEEALTYYTGWLEKNIKKFGEKSIPVMENYNDLGLISNAIGDYDNAFNYYLKAEENAIAFQDYTALINAYSGISNVYSSKKEYDTALLYIEKKKEIAQREFGENSIFNADSIRDASHIYREMGDNQTALELGKKSLDILHNIPLESTKDIIDSFYMDIGHIYYKEKDYTNAKDYFKKALILREETYGEEGYKTAESYLAYGRAINREDPALALYYFEKALLTYKKDKQYKYYLMNVYRNIAWSYDLQGDSQNAMENAILAYTVAAEADPLAEHLIPYKEQIQDIYSTMETKNEEGFETWFENNVAAKSNSSNINN